MSNDLSLSGIIDNAGVLALYLPRRWICITISLIILLGTWLLLLDGSEIVANNTLISSSTTKIKSILPIQRKDSEHGNQYLCEYLSQHIQQDSINNNNNNNNNETTVNSSLTRPSLVSSSGKYNDNIYNNNYYIDLDCGYDYGNSRLGNFLTRWYLTRMIAAKAGVTLTGSCKSASSVFRWMSTTNIDPSETIAWITNQQGQQGDVLDNDNNNNNNRVLSLYSWQDTCRLCCSNTTTIRDKCVFPHGNNDPQIGFAHALPLIQHDMETLSRGVVMTMMTKSHPTIHRVYFDDVAIHMRIGDIGRITSGRYGLIPFGVYKKYIPQRFNGSIGIVTAPFQQSRGHRPNDPTLNEAIVTSAKEYLQRAFPNANVSIRNDPNESHDVVFARLLLAKTMLFCPPSSYCLIPALGRTKAVGKTILVQSSLFGPIPGWLGTLMDDATNNLLSQANINLHYVSEPFLTSTTLQKLTLSDVLSRLQEETI
jgi:hypothetical protein